MIRNHFAVRIAKFNTAAPSNKPDGMFVRNNGLLTDSKTKAKIFETVQEAKDWCNNSLKHMSNWSSNTLDGVWIVPVITKTIIKQASSTALLKINWD